MEFRQGFLVGRSMSESRPMQLWQGAYDLLLLAPSWDRRCACLAACQSLRADNAILLSFVSRDKAGLHDSHEARLLQYCKQQAGTVQIIEGDSVNVDGVWRQLWPAVRETARRLGRPLRIALDLSTFPRYYALGTFAGAFRYGLAQSMAIFYAEGLYEGGQRTAGLDYQFSEGEWRTVPIPFLSGPVHPARKQFFVVSAGFEGFKTGRILARADPDRMAMLFPIPGTHPSYDSEVTHRNAAIVERFAIPQSNIVAAPAGDAVAAWRVLSERCFERPLLENTFYACCGTKPHALALAARAVCLGFPSVLYNVPGCHVFLDVHPSERFWRYDFEDASALD